VDRGLPLLLESDSWDVAALRNFVHAMFPTADTSDIENTAVLVWKTKDQITVKNADHMQAQRLAGIPFNQTMEGKLASSAAYAKATRIHWTVKFAEKAFEAAPTDGDYKLIWNNDVVDVWAKKTAPKDKCVVAWRGSNSLGDWLRNLQSQMFVPMAIDGIPANAGKGASGFVTRLHNLDNDIRRELSANGCKNIIGTGHSLGGAMAQLFALQLLHNTNFNVTDLRAYDPPRTGDETAQATFQNKQSQLESGYDIYCRNGDPVGPIPLGFVRFGPTTPGEYACTLWAPRVAWFNLPANHDLSLW
jgi:Lipase (class 3)